MASSFVGRVGALVSGRGRDEYKPVQMEEAAESRISLSTRPSANRYTDNADVDAEASVGLLSNEPLDSSESEVKGGSWRKEKKLCMCCGVDMTRPFKVLGVVGVLVFLFGAYKLLAWAFYEPPKGLEQFPEFGTSLGCLSAPFLYNDTKTHVLDAPMQPERMEHGIEIRGGGVGTLTLASSPIDSPNIRYEISLRSNDQDLLQRSKIKVPQKDASGNLYHSLTTISIPYMPKDHPETCVRYDVKMYVPPSLKGLHLASHSLAQIKFEKGAEIKLDELFVTLYGMNQNNMIQPSTSVKANQVFLELTRGWIVGDVSVVDETSIITQRGDGTAHVHVYPEPARDKDDPEKVNFQTTTGAGKTAVFFHKNKGAKRPIDSMHVSSKNAPVELTYKDAGFNGLVKLDVGQSKVTGLEKLEDTKEAGQEWTHFSGDKNGADRIAINSRGWVGLYL